MSRSREIAPLRVVIDDRTVHFQFDHALSNSLDVPPAFEEELRAVLDAEATHLAGKAFELDLANMPAISSRQLGMILTIRDVIKQRGVLSLRNISGSVRQLLQLTGTERFFDM